MSEVEGSRGSYPKGRATRQEIIRIAFEMFARQGYRATSIREIAREVGLTQTGLLHHFKSKEQLLMEVISFRDTLSVKSVIDAEPPTADPETIVGGLRSFESLVRPYESAKDFKDIFAEVVRRNVDQPGLVRLFAVLAGEATDPEHPAHSYFAERYRSLERIIREGIVASSEQVVRPGLDPSIAARLLLAVMDGLQIQWLLAPEFAMESAMAAMLEMLSHDPAQ